MNKANLPAAVLLLVALVCIFPGIYLPIFELDMSAAVKTPITNVNSDLFAEKRSILGTVEDLATRQRYLVAFLIAFFSIGVPIIKTSFLFTGLSVKNRDLAHKLLKIADIISKWSMADVFVIAILLTYMSTYGHMQAKKEMLTIMGMRIPVEIQIHMDSSLGRGFYFFLSYCLLSILSAQIMERRKSS